MRKRTAHAWLVALLLVVGLVLQSSGSSAECAWVLWGRNSAENSWAPRAAFSTQAECYSEHLLMSDEMHRRVTEVRRPEFSRHDYFECWPDTMAPRGAKGGTR